MGRTRTTIAQSTDVVIKNIYKIYAGRETEALQIAKEFAAMILDDFNAIQTDVGLQVKGEFWTNRTGRAASRWFTRAGIVGGNVYFYASQSDTVRYAEPLETWVESKQGKTSTQQMIDSAADEFLSRIEALYGGSFI